MADVCVNLSARARGGSVSDMRSSHPLSAGGGQAAVRVRREHRCLLVRAMTEVPRRLARRLLALLTENIVAFFADKYVVAGTTEDDVVTGATIKGIVAIAAVEPVAAVVAK